MPQDPTFDQELLQWLANEPASLRMADAGRIRAIAAEFAAGFDRLAKLGPAVTVFGSARTPRGHCHYALMRRTAAALGRAGCAVITGGGGGAMEADRPGAGALSVGCNIDLPREQDSTPIWTSRFASGTSTPARSCSCATRARLSSGQVASARSTSCSRR